jgi:hypothetical protein
MARARLLVLVGMLALGTLLLGIPAGARVEAESGYSKAQTYSGALRYLRVDLGYEVLEKDPDAAYLVFRYLPPGQPKGGSTGTLEVVDRGDNVRVFVRLPSMPEYHEVVLRDGLMKKLREEYGIPRVKKAPDKPAPSPPAADAGSD